MSQHRAWGLHPPEGQADDWHWLWEAYVAGMCVAAAAGVVMLDHRFPGNVPIAVTALAGIVWILFGTGTTLSVPALTGAIMCMGVATANSILVISFARERMAAGVNATVAAFEAGGSRFRPVLMTALAMVIGMLPMAIEPGQNQPLGRAVIGGLIFATCATLFLVPSIFSLVHGHRPGNANQPDAATPASH